MHEQQSDSDKSNPDILPVPLEVSLQSPDSLTATQFADYIMMSVDGSPHTDPETGVTTRQAQWTSSDQTLSFHLFSYGIDEQANGYMLEIHEKDIPEPRRYAFSVDEEISFSGAEGQEPLFTPNQEALRREIMHCLRDRYASTEHAARTKALFETAFQDFASRFSVEYALNFASERETGSQYISEAYSTDIQTRLRARRRLYMIAKIATIYCKEEVFNQALDTIIAERREVARKQRANNRPKLQP